MKPEKDGLTAAALSLRAQLDRNNKLREKLGEMPTEFRRRYLDWCLKQCGDECERDFSLLRRVRSAEVFTFLEYMDATPQPEREALLRALCKRLHAPGALGAADQSACERYLYFSREHHHGGDLTGARIPQMQSEIEKRFHERGVSTDMASRLIATELRDTIGSEIGSLIVNHTSALWYQRQIESWYVVTVFQFGGWDQLKYVQKIYGSPKGQRGTELSGGISILNWLGLSPVTSWTWITPEEVTPIVRGVGELCCHFLRDVEHLLGGMQSPFAR